MEKGLASECKWQPESTGGTAARGFPCSSSSGGINDGKYD
jgi:hypothetical protein